MEDPTVVMVNNLEYTGADFGVGFMLLLSAAIMEFIARLVHVLDDINPDTRITKVVRTPIENFNIARKMGYNYNPNYITLGSLPRVHYLDEGDQGADHVLLLLHGEPFWSFCWVNVIPHFTSRGYRVIAPDFVGFGMSDKPVNWRSYTLQLHKATVSGLLDHLNLLNTTKNVTLVGPDWGWMVGVRTSDFVGFGMSDKPVNWRSYTLQLHKDTVVGLLDHLDLLNTTKNVTLVGPDWGWMVGAAVARDFPDAFTRMVILNTNNMPDGELSPGRYSSTSAWIKFMTSNAWFLAFRASVNLLRTWFPLSVLIYSLMPGYKNEEVEAMLSPHPVASDYRGGTTAFPLMVPVSSSDPYAAEFTAVRYFLSTWRKPALVMYSETSLVPWLQEGDFVLGNRAIFYTKLIPGALTYRRIPNAGHLLMYDQPMAVASNILDFLKKIS